MRPGTKITNSMLQEAKQLLVNYLLYRYQADRGTIVSLYPRKVVMFYRRKDLMLPAILTYINYYLKEIANHGLASAEPRSRKGGQYLKFIIKKQDIPKVIELIKQL